MLEGYLKISSVANFGCIEKGPISIHLKDINSHLDLHRYNMMAGAWYQSISSSTLLPTKPVQWLEPKQVAAQFFPICAATGLPQNWLRNLNFLVQFFPRFKLQIFYYTRDI
jgi:hypothetical protein